MLLIEFEQDILLELKDLYEICVWIPWLVPIPTVPRQPRHELKRRVDLEKNGKVSVPATFP